MGRTARTKRDQTFGVNGEDQSPEPFSAIASILTIMPVRFSGYNFELTDFLSRSRMIHASL